MAKITIEEIKNELQTQGWELISTEYKNLDTELEYECSEGHRVFAAWKKFRGGRCVCPVCNSNAFKNIDTKIVPKIPGTKRLLALDQATKVSGFSVFDGKQLIKFGTYTAPDRSEIERDDAVKNWLISMIANWKPDNIALEGIQYQQNMGVTTFETLARLQGILMECCYEQKIPFVICPTNTWRHHCGVKGKSRQDRKKSMQLLVKDWFDISVTDDAADAIGIGKYAADITNVQVENWE